MRAVRDGGAVVVMPAALVLLGSRIDASELPGPGAAHASMGQARQRRQSVVRQYAVFAGFCRDRRAREPGGAGVRAPAQARRASRSCPASSQARIAFEQVNKVMGPGFATPYDMIVIPRNRPVTSPAFLASLDRFQAQIAKNPAVDSVTGPAAINSNAKQLQSFEPSLNHSMKISDTSKKQLVQLINGLASGRLGLFTAAIRAGRRFERSGRDPERRGHRPPLVPGTIHGDLAKAAAGSSSSPPGSHTALTAAIELRTARRPR